MLGRFNSAISRAKRIIRLQLDRRPFLPITILTAVAFIIFSFYSIERYLALQTNYFDLGLYASSIWRTIHGYSSLATLILPSTPGHIDHIAPLLGLVALAYALVPDPRTLLIIQAGAIALSAVPLYLIAVRETHNQILSLTIAGLFLANPALHGIIRFDFHTEAFIPLFVFLMYFAYPRQSPILFYTSLGALLSTIEYSAVLGVSIGISLWLAKKKLDRRILATLFGSLALVAVIAISTLGGAFQAWNWPAGWLQGQFLGSSPPFWSSPEALLASLQYGIPAKVTYLLVSTAPMWYSFWKYSARIIPAMPWMAIVVLSSRYSYSNVNFQYSVFFVPLVYFASIPLLYQIVKHKKIVLGMVLVALSFTILYGALSPTANWPTPSPLASTVASISNSLPQNATILTETDLYPQLSNRAYVSLNYSLSDPPKYILVNTDSPWYNWSDPTLGYPLSARQQTELLTRQYPYQLIIQDQGLHLYQL